MVRTAAAAPRSPASVGPDPTPHQEVSWWLVVALATAVLVSTTAAALVAHGTGAPGAGSVITVVAPVARALWLLGAVGAIGALVVAVLLPVARHGTLPATARPLAVAARRWAMLWGVAALCSMVLDLSRAGGSPVMDVFLGDDGGVAAATLRGEVRGLAVTAWAAGTVACFARVVQTRRGGCALLLVALGGLVPPALSGHSGSAPVEALAFGSILVHVVAVTLWMGGLLALCAHADRTARRDLTLLLRFSRLALVCFVAVVCSGVARVASSLTFDQLLDSGVYGVLLAVKVSVLLVLGGIGLLHRRRALPALGEGRPANFWSLVVVELVLMATALGLAVTLGSTAPA